MRLVLVNTFGVMLYAAVSNFVPIFLSGQGLSAAQIGQVYALGAVLSLLSPLFSIWADRTGKRTSLLISLLSSSVSYAGFTFNAYLGKLAEGLSSATWTMRAAIGDVCPKEQLTRVLGLLNGTEQLAYSIGLLVGGVLIGWVGFVPAFWAMAVCNLLLCAGVPRFPDVKHASTLEVCFRIPTPLLVLGAVSFVWGAGGAVMGIALPLLFSDFFSIDVARIGVLFGVHNLAFSLPPLLLGHRLGRLKARPLLVGAAVLSLAFTVLLFFSRDFVPFFMLLLGQASVYSFLYLAFDRLALDASRKENRAFDMSFHRTLYFAGGIMGDLLVGPVVESFGLHGAFLVQALELGVIAVLVFGR